MPKRILLLNRERIHVRAQRDGRCVRVSRSVEAAHHAGLCEPARDIEPEGAQFLGHEPAGSLLLEGEFGVPMQLLPPRGEFGEIDLTGSYSQQFGQFAVTAGVVSYNFPNAIGPSTHELFVAAATEYFTLKHTLTLYYDFDLLDDMYLNYMLAKSWGIQEGTNFDLSAMIGYMGSDQAAFYFGTDDSGLSDASITAGVSHTWDARDGS